MGILPFFLFFFLLQTSLSLSTTTLEEGSSLSIEKSSDYLVSENGVYSAGFFDVGSNAFSFGIWFTKSSSLAVAWMANRDNPVNGKGSKLSLMRNGDLSLSDAGRIPIWNSKTYSPTPVQLILLDTGNLVLRNSSVTLWQSFDSPTDTLLPEQPLTRGTQLVSSRSRYNHSFGFYTLYFDNVNVLRLLYNGPQASSEYWPDPASSAFQAGRTEYNNSRRAAFDNLGYFQSSDKLSFTAADFGPGRQRRLTLDLDGNLRMYSLEEATGNWTVSWQALSKPCMIHGICGPNSLCSYVPKSGRRCSCLPGFKMKNNLDWSLGCELDLELNISCNHTEVSFLLLPNVDFYGYDIDYTENSTLSDCEKRCLESCDCKGFMLAFRQSKYNCYRKFLLLNGFHSADFDGSTYLKIPKSRNFTLSNDKSQSLDCRGVRPVELDRTYRKLKVNEMLQFLLWLVCGIGAVEMACILLVLYFQYRTNNEPEANMEGNVLAAAGFKRFSYSELKKAARDFTQEIGRGAGGIVYKGILPDGRVAAIKRLNEASHGEAEFLAEVSTIGKLHHMNLIAMWGYCAEGNHRLLVYQYMEHGSLAENLSSSELTWKKRFEIAVGTAKGLAYLHEECLEWILHCDIKPQNILLDSNYQPKVADFGLSKLFNRDGLNNSSFSRLRGTRGYMAPEWVYSNLPITSKVDVYSYGIVLLEMVTGKGPTGNQTFDDGRLVTWAREEMNVAAASRECRLQEILDPLLASEYNNNETERLIRVALLCSEEDKDARPTMSQVVEMLLCNEDDYYNIFPGVHPC